MTEYQFLIAKIALAIFTFLTSTLIPHFVRVGWVILTIMSLMVGGSLALVTSDLVKRVVSKDRLKEQWKKFLERGEDE